MAEIQGKQVLTWKLIMKNKGFWHFVYSYTWNWAILYLFIVKYWLFDLLTFWKFLKFFWKFFWNFFECQSQTHQKNTHQPNPTPNLNLYSHNNKVVGIYIYNMVYIYTLYGWGYPFEWLLPFKLVLWQFWCYILIDRNFLVVLFSTNEGFITYRLGAMRWSSSKI